MLKQKFLPILIFTFTLLPTTSYPLDVVTAQQAPENAEVDVRQLDKRALILRDYLQRYDSPLQDHAQDFVDAADKYHLDWKLATAIAGVESTFGKQIPGGYNAWGWGVYGDQVLGFRSWREGIFEVSRGLKEGYIDQGLTDPMSMNRIYATSPVWGYKVSYFLEDLEMFSKKYDKQTIKVQNTLGKTAAPSAQLAFSSN